MINVTKELQKDIKTTIQSFEKMFNEAQDLENLYWKGSVSTDLAAVSLGTDPATQDTRLTKDQVISILTFCENTRKFFDNVAFGVADYMTTAQNSLYGNATATLVTQNIEAFSNRGVQFCRDSVTQFNRARDIENIYNSSELSAMIGSISTQTIVYGSDMTKDQLTSAVTLMQNWQDFLSNVATGTADRKVTLGKWFSL